MTDPTSDPLTDPTKTFGRFSVEPSSGWLRWKIIFKLQLWKTAVPAQWSLVCLASEGFWFDSGCLQTFFLKNPPVLKPFGVRKRMEEEMSYLWTVLCIFVKLSSSGKSIMSIQTGGGGWQLSTEVEFTLLTQLPLVQIPALPRFFLFEIFLL